MFIKNFIMACFIFFSLNLYAKNIETIEHIQFEGLQSISKEEVLKSIIFNIGKKKYLSNINKSVKSLFQTGMFQDIKVFYVGKNIVFKVKERPIISRIFITGNKIIRLEMLNKYLTELGIKRGSIFNPFKIKIFIKKLEDYYQDIGKYQVHIKLLKLVSLKNIVELKIIINEGVSTKIKNIKIVGNRTFSNKKIESLFKLKSCSNHWYIWNYCIYSSKGLEKNIDRLKNFYLNQGYYHFYINSKKIYFSEKKNNVNITINFHEGKKYTISQIFFNGNLKKYKKLIQDQMEIHEKEIYNKSKIDLSVEKIRTILLDHGYLNSEVNVYPEVDDIKNNIILNFNIDIKKRYFVHNISFRGNIFTQDRILRREIKQKEGVFFNKNLIESGKKALEKTQYFSDIKILTQLLSNDSNQLDVIYIVKENQTGSLNFGLGYGLDTGISTNFSFSQDNLLGLGNSFRASIVKNNYQKYADILMLYPYFISDNINLSNRIFYNNYKYPSNGLSSFLNKTSGFETNFSFLINSSNQLNLGVGYSHNNIMDVYKKNILHSHNNVSDKSELQNIFINDITFNYSWIYNNLKYFYFPISGNQINISGKNTVPGSDNHFYKFMIDNVQYIPFNRANTFLFSYHAYMGLSNSLHQEKLPFYEKFYANNANNIRGFQLNTIGPKKIYKVDNKNICTGYKNNELCESLESQGGNAIIMMNLEFIVPTPLINKSYANFFRSSFFFDAGSIWDLDLKKIENFPDYNKFKNNIYFSSGIALRWFSPIGPLVFSYSYPLFIQQNRHYQIEHFQFNIGKNW
ncbi:outer membrane protein assembly factor BamA [Buchnera aphidicola]|uniref:outer membrane protein assembly factor BamA n=1 Tax=Buchnera aphidicola TaxID=9 RepID=UPI003BEEBC2C